MSIEIKGKLEVVTTISGTVVKRTKCMYSKDTKHYYEHDVDCFKVDVGEGVLKWNRTDNGRITYNCETKKWDLISRLEKTTLLKGIYSANAPQGYFANRDTVVYLKEGVGNHTPIPCLNLELALKLGYISSLWDDFYYNKRNLSGDDISALKEPRILKYKNLEFGYNAADNNSSFRTIREKYSAINPDVKTRTYDMSKLLYGKSFGLEFETRGGTIPEKLLPQLGLVPLRDGSLRLDDGKEPYEYTTVPFSGAKGLETIKAICDELKKRCIFDESCSFHIHIGNIKYDEVTIMAYYMLLQNIQEEMYSMFPLYKRSEREYLRKPKDYNSPLPNIGLLSNTLFKKKYDTKTEFNSDVTKYFSKVIEFLTDGQHTQVKDWDTNQTFHPLGNTKWNIHSRYHNFNFNNLVFSNTRTLEARIHPATFNFTKVANWLFICIALVTYAEKNSKDIVSRKVKPSLNEILEGYKTSFGYFNFEDSLGTEVSNYLIEYVDFRKQAIKKANEKGDVLAKNIEFGADKDFKFTNGSIDNLY